MAINESLIYSLPEGIVSKISSFAIILQAVGIMAFLYLVFTVVKVIQDRKKTKELQKINKSLDEIKTVLKNYKN